MKKMMGCITLLCLLAMLLSVSALAADEPPCTNEYGHFYVMSEIVEPTCTEDGYTIHICEDCGYSDRQNYIDPNKLTFTRRLGYLCTYPGVDYSIQYMIFNVNREFTTESNYSAIVQVPAAEYEDMVRVYFAVTDADIEAIRNYKYDPNVNNSGLNPASLSYDAATQTYNVQCTGGFGGVMPIRTYLGYVDKGDTYEVYYADTNYLYLQELLPEGVDAWDYYEQLGFPATFEYGGYTFSNGLDGPFTIESYEPTGRKVTVEYNGEIVRILSCVDYTEKDLPFAYDDKDGGAMGHDWDAGVVTVQPTVDKEGVLTHTCRDCGATVDDVLPKKPAFSFRDVPKEHIFYDAIMWAVDQLITTGVSKKEFQPEGVCTRAQVVTFLWRAAGKPVIAGGENPFEDVSRNDYYYDAVMWAVDKGITNGMSSNRFEPNGTCNRGQIVTFMHRAKDKPAANASSDIFEDVEEGAYYYDAVMWAVENGITNGMSATEFMPNKYCTRGQVVTFMFRGESK